MEKQLQGSLGAQNSTLRDKICEILDQPSGDSDSKLAQLRAIAPNWQAILNSKTSAFTSVPAEKRRRDRREGSDRNEVISETQLISPVPSRDTIGKPEVSQDRPAKAGIGKEKPDLSLARQIKQAAEGKQVELVPGVIITRLHKGSIDNPKLADKIKHSACDLYNKICLDGTIARGWPNFCCLNCPKFKTS